MDYDDELRPHLAMRRPSIRTYIALLLRIVLLFLLVGNAACLASSSAEPRITKVISTNKNGGHSRTYSFHEKTQSNIAYRRIDLKNLFRNVQSGLRSTFLPSGYPSRTPPGYLRYSMWSWIQDISTQLRGVLATQRVLEGVGVGREGATALSALMNFLVRDGCGMAATLLFTSVAASRFQADVKRWRLFADIMVDIGITLEVAAVQLPHALFLPMISIGNMCKAICGVAAGACGGAINLHWAKGSDISDINAKFGAQHTVTGSLGLVFAALFARSVARVDLLHLWVLYTALTGLHILANMRCMRLIAFDSFNTVRMNMVMRSFLQGWSPPDATETTAPTSTASEEVARREPLFSIPGFSTAPLPTPQDIARQEPLFFFPGYSQRVSSVPIHFGVSFNEFSERSGKDIEQLESALPRSTSYCISAGYMSSDRPCVVVALVSEASPIGQTKAYFHAILLAKQLEQRSIKPSAEDRAEAEYTVEGMLESAWNVFCQKCQESGWDLTKTELRTKGYEIVLQS